MRVGKVATQTEPSFRVMLRHLEMALMPGLLPTEAEANVRRQGMLLPADFIGRRYRFSSGATVTVSLGGLVKTKGFTPAAVEALGPVLTAINAVSSPANGRGDHKVDGAKTLGKIKSQENECVEL